MLHKACLLRSCEPSDYVAAIWRAFKSHPSREERGSPKSASFQLTYRCTIAMANKRR